MIDRLTELLKRVTTHQNPVGLIYEWVKTGVITKTEFEYLFKNVSK